MKWRYAEHRTKRFLGQNACVSGNAAEECRHTANFAAILWTVQECSLFKCVLNLIAQNRCHIAGKRAKVCIWFFAHAEICDSFLKARHKIVVDQGFDICPLDCDAHSSSVREGTVRDPFNGTLEVTIGKDEGRIFAAEFKDGRNQVFCGTLSNELTMTAAAGEEDDVWSCIDQCCGIVGIVMQHLHEIGWQCRFRAKLRD